MKTTFFALVGLFAFSNADAQNIQFKQDRAGRLVRIAYPNLKAVNYSYDRDGNRTFRSVYVDSALLLPHPGTIVGPTTVCVGSTITLTDTAAGGSWSASNSHATVLGGSVTGVSAGVDTIRYAVTNPYGTATATYVVTVNPLPVAGSISGASSVCIGATVTLVDPVIGGVWSTANTTATVSGGLVTGVSAGTNTISYTVSNSCGTAIATKTVIIVSLPSAGTVTGPTSVCEGQTITLTDAVPGGTWTNTTGSCSVSGGIVTGISAGVDIIIYTVANSCGSANTLFNVTVIPAANCNNVGISTLNSKSTIKIYPDPTEGSFVVEMPDARNNVTIIIMDVYGKTIETRNIENCQGLREQFNLNNVAKGTYMIRVSTDNKTYENKVVIW